MIKSVKQLKFSQKWTYIVYLGWGGAVDVLM